MTGRAENEVTKFEVYLTGTHVAMYVYMPISQHNTVSNNVSRDCMVFIYAKNTSVIEAQIYFLTYLISDPRRQKFKLSNYTRSSEQQDMVAL